MNTLDLHTSLNKLPTISWEEKKKLLHLNQQLLQTSWSTPSLMSALSKVWFLMSHKFNPWRFLFLFFRQHSAIRDQESRPVIYCKLHCNRVLEINLNAWWLIFLIIINLSILYIQSCNTPRVCDLGQDQVRILNLNLGLY